MHVFIFGLLMTINNNSTVKVQFIIVFDVAYFSLYIVIVIMMFYFLPDSAPL